MATGKSTVGRLVADALDRPLVDSDDQVERITGLPPAVALQQHVVDDDG